MVPEHIQILLPQYVAIMRGKETKYTSIFNWKRWNVLTITNLHVVSYLDLKIDCPDNEFFVLILTVSVGSSNKACATYFNICLPTTTCCGRNIACISFSCICNKLPFHLIYFYLVTLHIKADCRKFLKDIQNRHKRRNIVKGRDLTLRSLTTLIVVVPHR